MYIVPISQLPMIEQIAGKQAVSGAEASGGGLPFSNVLSDAMRNLQETQAASSQNSYDLAMGNIDDLHTMQIDSMKASAAVDFTAGLASRALTAYNEIIRMQI